MNEDRSSTDPGDKTWIDKIAHLFNSEPKTRDDLLDVLQLARQNEVIEADTLQIIEGALDVSEMHVRDTMIPRSQMVVLKAQQKLDELLPEIIKSGHSRYPVVGETLDDVLGILLAKDLLPQLLNSNQEQFSIYDLLRPATFVPESKRLNVLLKEFRETRNHIAIVIDEYGGVAGLVTIEDVLEEIVGDIEDEYDIEGDSSIRKIADNNFIVKALTPIEEFNDYFKTDIDDDEFDTIGGIIVNKFGYLPKRNEETDFAGFRFKVLNADNRRIHLLRIMPVSKID